MEQLIGLLVFVGIVIAGNAFQKFVERQKQAERDAEPRTRVEDLPEETKRQLFGDTMTPPLAKPRGEGPPLAVPRRAAPPRRPVPVEDEGRVPPWERPAPAVDENRTTALESRDLDDESPDLEARMPGAAPWEGAASERLAPWEQAETPAAPQPPRNVPPVLRRPVPPRRMPGAPQGAPQGTPRMGDLRRRAIETMQQMMEQARQLQEPPASRPPRRPPAPQCPAEAPAPKEAVPPPQAARQQQAAPRRGPQVPSMHRLFGNLDNFRLGIVMHEVLGPPKSLRED